MFRILLMLILIGSESRLWSQDMFALPEITNYNKAAYGAGTQNWDIEQDKNGNMYFANNEGLLSFDGTYWKTYPLPNKTIVRSLQIGQDNRIYIGGQDEIGYFSPNKNGILSYISLLNLIPEKFSSFADIWNIVKIGNDLYFRSSNYIFRYSDNSITVYPASSSWVFMAGDGKQLIAQDQQNGLLVFSANTWSSLIYEDKLPEGFLATSVTPVAKDSSLLTTWKGELFILSNGKISRFNFTLPPSSAGQVISDAVMIDSETIGLATSSSGCLIINRQGKIIHSYSRKNGLQNNNVITLFLDKTQNIWLGLDNGIDFIAHNNAVKHINPLVFDETSGYSSLVHNGHLYFGLSNGVFRVPFPEEGDLSNTLCQFERVQNISGQVWGLSEVNGHLLISKHEGAYLVNNNRVELVRGGNGFWTFQPYFQTYPSTSVIAGNYKGIELYDYKNGIFSSKGTVKGFSESARFVTIDNNQTIWASHPYRGVYKIDWKNPAEAEVKLYTSKDGLPSSLNNHVYEIRNRIVVGTEKGVYEYDAKSDSFIPSVWFEPFFHNLSIRYLTDDPDGNIWFIHEKNVGIVDVTGKKPELIYFPELVGKMLSGFEHIYPFNSQNVFIGAEKGFYHINYEKYRKNTQIINVRIRSVMAFGKTDTLLFGGYFGEVNEMSVQRETDIPVIRFNQNSLHFEFSSSKYTSQPHVQYSWYLDGFDKSWSEWSKKTEKDYTNLPAGTYHFIVKARNNLGNESETMSYSFTITPPWYKSSPALFLYFLLFIVAGYALYKVQHRRLMKQQFKHQEEHRRLQYLHQLEMEKTEKELMQLRNEKLESEIDYKNSELASTAMHLVQKGELLTKIKSELLRLNKESPHKEVAEDIKKIIRILGEEERMDEDWQQFAVHFDKVHSDFLVALKESFPNLSSNELKLCAYLRMNLSSKEIAQLLNISVRGIEISRYRLRKKLQIPTETNLFQFLLEFHSSRKAPSASADKG